MKNNIIYKVLGILFSVLIVASIFLPYVKADNASLFEIYKSNNQIVLPIVLALFGVASALFYLFNFYIEFSLSTGGALLFYTITEVVSIINQNAFSEINYGFYLLIGGTIGLIITTILYIVSSKINSEEEVRNDYNNSYEQSINNNYDTVIPVGPVVEPLEPVINRPIVAPIQPVTPVAPVQPQPVIDQPIVEPVQPQPVVEPVAPVQLQPVIDQPTVEPVQPQPIIEQAPVITPVVPVQLQPVIDQPIVEPVQPQPIIEQAPVITPVVPVQPIQAPITELKPIEEPIVVPLTEHNPLPDLQFEPIEEVIEESKPVNQAPVEPPLNPVLQQFEIPTSFLNSGRPSQSTVPETINTDNSTPSVGMDIFNNH